MNYFNSDISNSTNTVVYFDGNDGNLYLRLRTMSHTIHAAEFEQTITIKNVTIVTENTVSMNQGNTEAHEGQKRVVRTKCDIYVFFYYYHCIDTSACGLLVPEGITSPIVTVY
jgi:hypothetical protein